MSLNRLPGIANPQNTKGLGHFLTTDYKSVETPNGRNEQSPARRPEKQSPARRPEELSPARRPGGFEIRRKKRFDL